MPKGKNEEKTEHADGRTRGLKKYAFGCGPAGFDPADRRVFGQVGHWNVVTNLKPTMKRLGDRFCLLANHPAPISKLISRVTIGYEIGLSAVSGTTRIRFRAAFERNDRGRTRYPVAIERILEGRPIIAHGETQIADDQAGRRKPQ